jgi:hypothetical protein
MPLSSAASLYSSMAVSSGTAFVMAGVPAVPRVVSMASSAAPQALAVPTQEQPRLTPLAATIGGVACGVVGAVAAQRKRVPVVQRRFFGGGASPPPPAKLTSYKDFSDPWLGSADLSFDPANLAIQGGIFDKAATAVPETTYYNYRESEVKHGRFAMAAFLAIFAESADRSALFHQLGSKSALDNLDGTLGLDEVQAPVLLVGLGYQALAEYSLQSKEKDDNFLSVEYKRDRCPGDLGFDPLALGSGPSADKKGLHNIEVNTGRLAMIGVTSFLFKEFVLKDASIASKIL